VKSGDVDSVRVFSARRVDAVMPLLTQSWPTSEQTSSFVGAVNFVEKRK